MAVCAILTGCTGKTAPTTEYDGYDETALMALETAACPFDPEDTACQALPEEPATYEPDFSQYAGNRLDTGDKPYASQVGKAKTGSRYLEATASPGETDYIMIVKKASNGQWVNHVYIHAGTKGRLNVPAGTYNVYFYSGQGWCPDKPINNLLGAFVEENELGKDANVNLSDYEGYSYKLYPVSSGNFQVQYANKEEL